MATQKTAQGGTTRTHGQAPNFSPLVWYCTSGGWRPALLLGRVNTQEQGGTQATWDQDNANGSGGIAGDQLYRLKVFEPQINARGMNIGNQSIYEVEALFGTDEGQFLIPNLNSALNMEASVAQKSGGTITAQQEVKKAVAAGS